MTGMAAHRLREATQEIDALRARIRRGKHIGGGHRISGHRGDPDGGDQQCGHCNDSLHPFLSAWIPRRTHRRRNPGVARRPHIQSNRAIEIADRTARLRSPRTRLRHTKCTTRALRVDRRRTKGQRWVMEYQETQQIHGVARRLPIRLDEIS
jgi:hypothetical protein